MPGLTRRTLISKLALAGAAALWWLGPLGTRRAPAAAGTPEHRLWADLVGQRFGLAGGPDLGVEPRAGLVLDQVAVRACRDDRHRPPHLRPAAISLLFSSTAGPKLASATYSVTHPRLGTVRLYIDRTVCADYPRSAIYEAVLN